MRRAHSPSDDSSYSSSSHSDSDSLSSSPRARRGLGEGDSDSEEAVITHTKYNKHTDKRHRSHPPRGGLSSVSKSRPVLNFISSAVLQPDRPAADPQQQQEQAKPKPNVLEAPAPKPADSERPKKVDADFGSFERVSSGFASRLMAKMGFDARAGKGLGKSGNGIINPITVEMRDGAKGIGFGEKKKQVQHEDKGILSHSRSPANNNNNNSMGSRGLRTGKAPAPHIVSAKSLLSVPDPSNATILDFTHGDPQEISLDEFTASAATAAGSGVNLRDIMGKPHFMSSLKSSLSSILSDTQRLARDNAIRVKANDIDRQQFTAALQNQRGAAERAAATKERLMRLLGECEEVHRLIKSPAMDDLNVAIQFLARLNEKWQKQYSQEYSQYQLNVFISAMLYPLIKRGIRDCFTLPLSDPADATVNNNNSTSSSVTNNPSSTTNPIPSSLTSSSSSSLPLGLSAAVDAFDAFCDSLRVCQSCLAQTDYLLMAELIAPLLSHRLSTSPFTESHGYFMEYYYCLRLLPEALQRPIVVGIIKPRIESTLSSLAMNPLPGQQLAWIGRLMRQLPAGESGGAAKAMRAALGRAMKANGGARVNELVALMEETQRFTMPADWDLWVRDTVRPYLSSFFPPSPSPSQPQSQPQSQSQSHSQPHSQWVQGVDRSSAWEGKFLADLDFLMSAYRSRLVSAAIVLAILYDSAFPYYFRSLFAGLQGARTMAAVAAIWRVYEAAQAAVWGDLHRLPEYGKVEQIFLAALLAIRSAVISVARQPREGDGARPVDEEALNNPILNGPPVLPPLDEFSSIVLAQLSHLSSIQSFELFSSAPRPSAGGGNARPLQSALFTSGPRVNEPDGEATMREMMMELSQITGIEYYPVMPTKTGPTGEPLYYFGTVRVYCQGDGVYGERADKKGQYELIGLEELVERNKANPSMSKSNNNNSSGSKPMAI